jgi:glycine/D-amino acid oxidase-like deaminating enzyme
MISEDAEIVIVGGGIIGSAAAYFLAKAGRDVALVERGDLGGEASVANGAFVWTSTRRPGIDLDLALASIALHKQFQEELGLDTEYRRPGGMIIIEDEGQLPAIEAFRKAREKVGFNLTTLDAKETRTLEPLLSERIVGAVYNPLDGGTNPFRLIMALNWRAEEMGARIHRHTEVSGLQMERGKVTGVRTDRGTIRTGLVVNSCGAWASFVGRMVGIDIPIIPNEMEFVVTEQMPPLVHHIVMGASYLTQEYSKEEMIADRSKFGCGLCIHQTASGNLLLGATWRFVGYDKRTSYEETVAIAKEVVRLFPPLKDVHVIRTFANFFPFTPDDLPILDFVDGVEGLLVAAGHCGHGICLGPITGKLVSELICEGKTSMPIDELRLSRFLRESP